MRARPRGFWTLAGLLRLGAGVLLGASLNSAAQSQDLSEALRLWKFTYQLELTAYGTQYMSKDLLLKAGDQLEAAAGQTMVTNSEMTVCIDATNHLAEYFRASAGPTPVVGRGKARAGYELARVGCMRLLGADPAKYPLGWSN